MMDPATTPPPGDPGQQQAPPPDAPSPFTWDGIVTKREDGTEKMADWATWKDKLPEPVRKFIGDNITYARAKTEGMFKVPAADAPPEEWEPLYKALGRPDSPDGYNIAPPEQLPDGVTWNEDFAKEFAQLAHSAGISKGQAEKLMAWHTEQIGGQVAAMQQAATKLVEKERAELQQTFGPRLAEVAGTAQKIAQEMGLPPDMFNPAAADFLGVGALRVVAGLTERLAKFTQEGGFGGPGGVNPATGGYEYAMAVIRNNQHPDHEKYWKGDADVVKRVREGMAQMPAQKQAA